MLNNEPMEKEHHMSLIKDEKNFFPFTPPMNGLFLRTQRREQDYVANGMAIS